MKLQHVNQNQYRLVRADGSPASKPMSEAEAIRRLRGFERQKQEILAKRKQRGQSAPDAGPPPQNA